MQSRNNLIDGTRPVSRPSRLGIVTSTTATRSSNPCDDAARLVGSDTQPGEAEEVTEYTENGCQDEKPRLSDGHSGAYSVGRQGDQQHRGESRPSATRVPAPPGPSKPHCARFGATVAGETDDDEPSCCSPGPIPSSRNWAKRMCSARERSFGDVSISIRRRLRLFGGCGPRDRPFAAGRLSRPQPPRSVVLGDYSASIRLAPRSLHRSPAYESRRCRSRRGRDFERSSCSGPRCQEPVSMPGACMVHGDFTAAIPLGETLVALVPDGPVLVTRDRAIVRLAAEVASGKPPSTRAQS